MAWSSRQLTQGDTHEVHRTTPRYQRLGEQHYSSVGPFDTREQAADWIKEKYGNHLFLDDFGDYCRLDEPIATIVTLNPIK